MFTVIVNGQDGLVLFDIMNHTLEGWVESPFQLPNN